MKYIIYFGKEGGGGEEICFQCWVQGRGEIGERINKTSFPFFTLLVTIARPISKA